jgi:hypothetical protein
MSWGRERKKSVRLNRKRIGTYFSRARALKNRIFVPDVRLKLADKKWPDPGFQRVPC